MLSQRKVFQAEYELDLLPEVLERISAGHFLDEPLVAIYHATYRMLLGDASVSAFEDQVQLLDQHGRLLQAPDRGYHVGYKTTYL